MENTVGNETLVKDILHKAFVVASSERQGNSDVALIRSVCFQDRFFPLTEVPDTTLNLVVESQMESQESNDTYELQDGSFIYLIHKDKFNSAHRLPVVWANARNINFGMNIHSDREALRGAVNYLVELSREQSLSGSDGSRLTLPEVLDRVDGSIHVTGDLDGNRSIIGYNFSIDIGTRGHMGTMNCVYYSKS